MSLSAGGIGSGLDVNSLVSQLVNAEALRFQPKAALQSEYKSRLSLYGTIKSNLAELGDFANKIRGLAKGSLTTTISDPTVLNASLTTNTNSSYTIRSTQLASRQSVQTDTYATGLIDSGGGVQINNASLTITVGSIASAANGNTDGNNGRAFTAGTAYTLNDITSDATGKFTLEEIRDKINAKAGLKDKVEAVVEDVDGGGKRLVIQSKLSGAADAFSVSGGTNGLAALNFDPSAINANGNITQTQGAKDAKLRINGVGYASATNEFSNPVSGLNLTLLKVDANNVTVTGTFGTDNAAIKSALSEFVTAYNKTVGNLKANQEKGAKLNRDQVPGRIEGGIRSLLNSKVSVTSNNVTSDKSMTDYGLSISKEGILSFSSSKYDAAIAGDPDAGIKFFGDSAASPADSGLFTKLATFLTNAIGSNGILTQRNNSLNSAIARIETERSRFSARIDRLEERLFKQFTALDASLSGLQSTQNLLAQRLGALQQQ